ncbi:helix-turn-helix transcriptional regulator [Stutzerimonas stutzeri]|uniref:helix-turn-helix transcriptional regulator n=1 Tax=Stutzerimonas stutzeri TaxID=316 RepID=UPI00244D4CA1|nr:AlpA family transcriptional regulator [Stutzerimonas stutzeri]MCF6782609.1 AlpA family transcriptional regulator [Stutzerimonas stutzeri]MCF6805714.1 AlpA family transcriptional regulator [Stutzerimonas stutzeri]MDH0099963.1 AlpA family transcriptional regulator [Stutzerimonas stutzeri]
MNKSNGDGASGPRLIRRKEVLLRVGLSVSTLYEMISRGEFPRPVQIGRQAVAWVDSEISEWIQQRLTARNAKESNA